MSKISKVKSFLISGETLTAEQIRVKFKLKNPHDAIRALRSQGICIYSNSTKNSNTVTYQVGKPNKRMVKLSWNMMGCSIFKF